MFRFGVRSLLIAVAAIAVVVYLLLPLSAADQRRMSIYEQLGNNEPKVNLTSAEGDQSVDAPDDAKHSAFEHPDSAARLGPYNECLGESPGVERLTGPLGQAADRSRPIGARLSPSGEPLLRFYTRAPAQSGKRKTVI